MKTHFEIPASEMVPLSLIVLELSGEKDLWCDKRLFSLVNRALNLCAHKASVKVVNEQAISFSVIPFPPKEESNGEEKGVDSHS